MSPAKGQCLLCAFGTALVLLCWQAAIVRVNYDGNWTGLFLTGKRSSVPPSLAASTYVLKRGAGYDGQFYRYVAHDPLMRNGMVPYVDAPEVRYQRILVPAMAALLSLGKDGWVDHAYIGVVLLFVFAGAWWLSNYAVAHKRAPWWGALFGIAPATLISVQRMTVDVALAAFCMGMIVYLLRDAPARVYGVAVLGPLVRDTGALLIALCCVHALVHRQWRRAMLFATAVVPAIAWHRFEIVVLPKRPEAQQGAWSPNWIMEHPLIGIFQGFWHLPHYRHLSRFAGDFVRCLDAIAIAGVILALGLAVWQIRRIPVEPEVLGAILFAGLTALVSAPTYWTDISGYGRTLTPLVLFVGIRALSGKGGMWNLAPWLMMDGRLGVEFGLNAVRIVKAVL